MLGIIIFGTKGVERSIGSGLFHCPTCSRDSPYTRMKVTRFFTLYFIPLIPLGSMGELVRCDQCKTSYSSEVLSDMGGHVKPATSPWQCRSCPNLNPGEYTTCVSCGGDRYPV